MWFATCSWHTRWVRANVVELVTHQSDVLIFHNESQTSLPRPLDSHRHSATNRELSLIPQSDVIDVIKCTNALHSYFQDPLVLWCVPGSSVYIATELPGWTVRARIPVGTRLSARPDRPWASHSLLLNGYRVFPGGKVRPGRAADHSPPSSAAVMEE